MVEDDRQNTQTSTDLFEKMEILELEDPRERDPGLLTYDDREYLAGEKEFTGKNGRQQENTKRMRIRNRIYNGLLDFRWLQELDEKDRRLIFDKAAADLENELYWALKDLLGFVYLGVEGADELDFKRLLESAVSRAERSRTAEERVQNVTITIDVQTRERMFADEARQRLDDGEYIPMEAVGTLAVVGELTQEDLEFLEFEFPEKLEGVEDGNEFVKILADHNVPSVDFGLEDEDA